MAIYVADTPGPMEVLLQSGSVSDALAVNDLLEVVAQTDARVIEQVRARADRLGALRTRLADEARSAEEEIEIARSRERQLRVVIASRRQALAGAQAELGRLLAAERERVARLAAEKRLRQAAERRSPASAQAGGGSAPGPSAGALPPGSHVFPIAGPSTFSDDWLASRPGGRYHEGIDLFAARGTPVVAVADGTLSQVGYSGISGYRLWLRDGAGTAFFYAHLDGYSPAAREGASVRKGEVIGYNGDTGDARGTSPHVHFQVHPGGGGPVRPYPIVSAWPRVG